jgi:hypothetical protein
MSEERDELAFVRRVAEIYAPPPQTPTQRAAFSAALEARLRNEGRRGRALWGFATIATAATLILVLRMLPDRTQTDATPDASALASEQTFLGAASAQEAAILALALDSETARSDALPPDYEAIAGVFLGS